MKQKPDVEAALRRALHRIDTEFDIPAKLVADVLPPRGFDDLDLRPVRRRPLTERETQILNAASHGLGDRETAETLDIAYDTVRTHMKHILFKLAAKNRTHAVAIGLRRRLIL